MYRYTCVFKFGIIYETAWSLCEVSTENYGISAFSKGFWINDELKFTKTSDCKFWIPPSQILYVEKTEIARKEGSNG